MSIKPTIISYRSQNSQTSCFLNVNELLKNNNYEKVTQIYNDIYQSVTAYEPTHASSLIKVEKKLYQHITKLGTEKKKEFAQKNKGWKSIVLSFLTLGIRPTIFLIKNNQLTNTIKKMNSNHSKFLRSITQMEKRGLEKKLHSKPEKMVELEKQRLTDLDHELFRLKSIPRVAKSLKNVNKKIKLSKSHQVAYGQSLELQEQLKDTHYVINHGQNLELMVVNIIARQLKQEFEPDRYESFKPLRHDTALRHIKENHNPLWYINEMNKGRIDHAFRKELICGDCILESTARAESALYFFAGNTNIATHNNPSLISDLLLTIIQDYIPNEQVATKLCKDLVNLFAGCPRGGNIYSICVPKEKFNESCYFSKPFGRATNNQEILEKNMDKMQSGKISSRNSPQVRILTNKIRPEDGYHTILNSTCTSDQLAKIDTEVALCIQTALTSYRIQKQPERIFGK